MSQVINLSELAANIISGKDKIPDNLRQGEHIFTLQGQGPSINLGKMKFAEVIDIIQREHGDKFFQLFQQKLN